MGSRGRPLFDLNETPKEEDEEIDGSVGVQPQKVLPSLSSSTSDLLVASVGQPSVVNNNAFSHASSVSGFQPFVRSNLSPSLDRVDNHRNVRDQTPEVLSSKTSNDGESKGVTLLDSGALNAQTEKEEGEMSDGECSDSHVNSRGQKMSFASGSKPLSDQGVTVTASDRSSTGMSLKDASHDSTVDQKRNQHNSFARSELGSNNITGSSSHNSNGNAEGKTSMDAYPDIQSVPKQKEVKGIEASYALKCANNPGKHKLDEHKEAMLGKKRSRKTMFLNMEDVKQADAVKSSTPRRQSVLTASSTRSIKGSRNVRFSAECNGEKQNEHAVKEQNQADLSCNDERGSMESNVRKSECNTDMNAGLLGKPRRLNSSGDLIAEGNIRHNSWKQPTDSRQFKEPQVPLRKPASNTHGSVDTKPANKKNPPKRPNVVNNQYQDTSVERLLREVTSEKFWHNPEESELQCVPGHFESVEEYIRVFEPLLFEECRAQLYSTWEELSETSSRDAHVMVRVKSVERRERGWYDVIVLPTNEIKWTFKEGDVAVLSSLRPGSVRSRRNIKSSVEEHEEPEGSGRTVGTVRRHIPLDVRDPQGATLHFFVGDSYDPSSNDNDHIVRKLQPRSIWFLSVLGSLATTQREYVALHAFRRLNMQMQNAILKPGREHFPKYEEQTPAIPECFTPHFSDHLNRTFNSPQLSAIQWAAMHTAAGTSNGTSKRQEPWPFTLVQGPPGTGKTHTVWGMLNVIHLVQYQHYYTALLKKLAPERDRKSVV